MSSGSNNHNYDSVCKSAAASVEIDFKTMERVLTTLEKRDTFINMCLSGVTGYILASKSFNLETCFSHGRKIKLMWY